MLNVKLAVIAGVAGTLLSFIIGIISDVTAGAVILRALLSGVIFAAIVSGARILIGKFLPELLDGPETEENRDEQETGGNVNIVLDDDSAGEEVSGFSDAPVNGEGTDENSGPGEFSADPAAFTSGSGEVGASEYDADEVEELEPVSGDYGDAGEVEELETVSETGDGVPDIGAFENTFSPGPAGLDSLGDSEDGPKSSGTGSFEVLGGEHDVSEAAQAIQTILKKDQEG